LRLRFLVCLIHPLPLLGYEHPIPFTCRGRHTLGCSRLDRLARASSNIMETKEEQHVEVGKVRVKRKGKYDKK
jgi:hypothetical protein